MIGHSESCWHCLIYYFCPSVSTRPVQHMHTFSPTHLFIHSLIVFVYWRSFIILYRPAGHCLVCKQVLASICVHYFNVAHNVLQWKTAGPFSPYLVHSVQLINTARSVNLVSINHCLMWSASGPALHSTGTPKFSSSFDCDRFPFSL